mgnify:CR=1 FL=1
MSEREQKDATEAPGKVQDPAAEIQGGAENREFQRVEVTALVDCTGRELLLNHRVSNISLGGICILSESVEETGAIVDLVINFPDQDSSMAVQGEVVWCNIESPRDMGIRYLNMDEDRLKTLRRFLNARGS